MVHNRNNLEMEILLVLIKEQTHLRNIAKLISESHSTVLRKLNILVEENVLDYRIEGRNKVFFIKNTLQSKNYVFNAERYKLIKLLKKYPKLNIIIEDVLKQSNQSLIILFGSYAKFKAKKTSDIDIYVETKDIKVKERIEEINSEISVKIGSFNPTDLLIKEIIKSHVVLKGVEEFYEKTKFFE